MASPTIIELIKLKQQSDVLSSEQIEWLVKNILNGNIHDAQIGALLMAIYLNGMSNKETGDLTNFMTKSGHVLSWPDEWKDLVVDKHSTGGVGDKISLVLAPSIAACGLKIPMISGRSLDYTGGTLDKMESIPGCNIQFSADEMKKALDQVGCCIVGQTGKIAPADKVLYSLRDITSTVSSNPLIVSSIISKKAAESLKCLVMDVKFGCGSFQNTLRDAERLAHLLVDTGRNMGINTSAILTDMNSPLGFAIGNSLEVIEAVQCLKGNGPQDVIELVVTQGGELLHSNKAVTTLAEGKAKIEEVLKNGKALDKFRQMLTVQGVSEQIAAKVCESPDSVLPLSSNKTVLRLATSGFVIGVNALTCGKVSFALGAGRTLPSDSVTYNTGLHLCVGLGDKVKEGEPWVTVYHVEPTLDEALIQKLAGAISIAEEGVKTVASRVHGIIRSGEDAHVFPCQ